MQEISRNNLLFELKINHLEDLWVLSQFISQNDIIYSTTKRKVAIGNDKTKQVTKIMYVELNVQKVVYETDLLRVQGEILNETDFTAIGQSHTLSFSINDSIKIQKKVIHKFELVQLEKALNSKHSLNLGVLFDKDELVAFEFSQYGYKVLITERNLGSKKGYSTITIDDNEEKYSLLKPLLEKSYASVVLAGPGKFKDSLKKYLSNKSISVLAIDFSEVTSNSITKLISSIYKSNLLQDSQIAQEEEVIGELLKRINQESRVSYGEKNVFEKIQEGNVDSLLVSTNYVDKIKEMDGFFDLQNYFSLVEQLQGSIIIIHSKHASGHVLDGLGGIGALLRY